MARVAAQVLANAANLADLASAEEVEALLGYVEQAESDHYHGKATPPLLDPGRFLRDAEALVNDPAVVRAFAQFKEALDAARQRLHRVPPRPDPRTDPGRGTRG